MQIGFNKFKKNGVLSSLAAMALIGVTASPVLAKDPAFFSLGVGSYDWNRQKDEGVEIKAEYRHDKKIFGLFKPFAAVSVAKNSSTNYSVGVGILMDVYFGKRWVLTPSFAPHYYNGGNKKLNLDYALEFRSQVELAYRFDDRSRVGMAVSHYSNASLGKTNPGTEAATLYYSVPVNFFN